MSTQAGSPNYPAFTLGLMNSAPGSIDRRFPKYWSDNEGGIDWSAPVGTPVVALADGTVVGAGYFCYAAKAWNLTSDSGACDHGVITTRVTNSDGSQTDLYYQHIILNSSVRPCFNGVASCGGQTVKKGQVIGYISDFGMLEMGVNVGNSTGGPVAGGAHWGGIWGADPNPGPHVDPESYLRALIGGQNTTGTLAGSGLSGGGNPLDPLSFLSGLQPWLNNPVRLIKMIAGIGLIFISLFLLTSPEGQLMQKVSSIGKQIGGSKK